MSGGNNERQGQLGRRTTTRQRRATHIWHRRTQWQHGPTLASNARQWGHRFFAFLILFFLFYSTCHRREHLLAGCCVIKLIQYIIYSLQSKKAGKTGSNWSFGDNRTNWDRLYWFGCGPSKLGDSCNWLRLLVAPFGVKKPDRTGP